MEKKLACYDIDGTLTKGMLATPLVISEYQRGFVNTTTCIELAKLVIENKLGIYNYEKALDQLLRVHALGLKGQSEAELKNHAEKFIRQHDSIFRKSGRAVINLLRDSHDQIIVTAEPRYIAEAVQEYFRMDGAISTQYEIVNGIFTGKVAIPLASFDSKLISIEDRDIDFALGNTKADKGMLENATHPICFYPTKELKKIAEEKAAEGKIWTIYDDKGAPIVDVISGLLAS